MAAALVGASRQWRQISIDGIEPFSCGPEMVDLDARGREHGVIRRPTNCSRHSCSRSIGSQAWAHELETWCADGFDIVAERRSREGRARSQRQEWEEACCAKGGTHQISRYPRTSRLLRQPTDCVRKAFDWTRRRGVVARSTSRGVPSTLCFSGLLAAVFSVLSGVMARVWLA
jgi:hypothetical protein